MKKTLLFAAVASVALAGCVKNDPANGGAVASDAKISFDAPAVGAVTRAVAGEIVNPYDKEEHFTVYARHYTGNYTNFNAGTPYMTAVETAYNETGNCWDSESAGGQAYYWPKNGKLTFQAYSPTDAALDCTPAWTASGFTFTNFTVKQNPAEHYDLMFSERSYNRTASTGGTHYNGVDINFKHALSSVVFKVKTGDAYANHTITLKSIKLLNAYETGDFNQNLADLDGAMTTAAAWENQRSEYNAGYEVVTAEQELNETAADVTNANPIIVLPQELAHAGANNVSIAVEYTLHNGTAEIEQTGLVDISDGYSISEFELGKRYIFTLTFALDKIYFSPEVEAWEDVEVTGEIKF